MVNKVLINAFFALISGATISAFRADQAPLQHIFVKCPGLQGVIDDVDLENPCCGRGGFAIGFKLSAVMNAVRKCPEVRSCHLMTGMSDYLLRLEARDAADYERIHKDALSRMPGVARIQSSFAIRTVIRG